MLEQKLFTLFRDIIYPLFIQRCVYILPAFKFTQFFKEVYGLYGLWSLSAFSGKR